MRCYVLVLLALLLSQQPATAMASRKIELSEHAKGVHYFKNKQYNLAAYHLKRALEQEPRSASDYYYLANSLVHIDRHVDAIKAYKRSYQLDPFGPLSGFCRQALITYKVSLPETVSKAHHKPLPMYKEGSPQNKVWPSKGIGKNEVVEETTGDDGSEGSSEEATTVKEQTVHDHHLNTATAMIRRQAADEKARKKQYTDYITENLEKTGQAKANRIKADAEEQIKELYEGPLLYDSQGVARSRGVPSWRLSPTMQEVIKNRADQIRRDAEARAELELAISSDKSSEYKKWYMDREEDLDSVAEALETQLQQPSGRSGIILNPIGTGLYVRNYSSFSPKHPIPEAHSSVVRFVDRGFEDNQAGSESSFKVPDLKLEVRGSVIE